MFYDNVKALCKNRRVSITKMATDIGLSNAASNSWKNGSMPKGETLQKIADYFGVSIDVLLSDAHASNSATNITGSAVMQGNTNGSVSINNGGTPTESVAAGLTDQEMEVLRIFRDLDMRKKNTVLTYLYEIEDQAKE